MKSNTLMLVFIEIYVCAGFFHVGPVKKGNHFLLNGMMMMVLSKEFTKDLEQTPCLLCNLIHPANSFWLLVMTIWLNFGIWTTLGF